jgi:hypothetical protein
LAALIPFTSERGKRQLLAWLLPALWLHLLVPAGFMPAPGHPLSVEICPDGPAHPLEHAVHHPHHGAGHGHGAEHCAFGMASGCGPLSCHALNLPAPSGHAVPGPVALATVPLVQLVHLPEPRGPPALV